MYLSFLLCHVLLVLEQNVRGVSITAMPQEKASVLGEGTRDRNIEYIKVVTFHNHCNIVGVVEFL